MKKPLYWGFFITHTTMKMKYLLLLTVLLPATFFAQTTKEFSVVFYNVENLFDTKDDEGVMDEEYTPESEKQWTDERYRDKLEKLGKVLSASTADGLPEVIGLCEVENRGVVEDLMKQRQFKKGKYKVVHEDSPDGRGIDVAFVYSKKALKVIAHEALTVNLPGEDARPTRDILHVTAVLPKKDTVHFFVNHWPSRYGGEEQSQPKRMMAAKELRGIVDELLTENHGAKIVIMGDFNDYPTNESMNGLLRAKSSAIPEDTLSLVNLAYALNEQGLGSYNYRGEWGMLDQIIVSQSLLSPTSKGLCADMKCLGIVKEEWMLYTNTEYGDQRPSRTYGGDNYYGGYSDHLPVVARFGLR